MLRGIYKINHKDPEKWKRYTRNIKVAVIKYSMKEVTKLKKSILKILIQQKTQSAHQLQKCFQVSTSLELALTADSKQ